MNNSGKITTYFGGPTFRHILFWLSVFAYFVGTVNMRSYSGYIEVIEHFSIHVFCQMTVAYTTLYVLIPRFLTPKKYLLFALSLLALLILVFVIFVACHEYYHIPKYRTAGTPYNSTTVFLENVFDLRLFLGKFITILSPTILLVIAKFYRERQAYLQLNEQKKSAELSALKHQLNPHFLFNTLNNLYALSINKSDEAPEVIAKLSEILDYMLYGCNDQYVPLNKEIELIENYLSLEKVRYDDRVKITFTKDIKADVSIAPLILLTFIENAFKHGVSQELKKAYIHINIVTEGDSILFDISNSKALNMVSKNKDTIGLTNVKKQLDLLYSESYSLDVKEENDCFNVHLKLPVK